MMGEAADARHKVVFIVSHPVVFFFWYADGYLIHVSLSPLIKVASGYWRKIQLFDQSETRKFRRVVGL